uniref:Uncharacterized protein n=1 Tax=Anguilla anguilla TaxID=7936 RepID=A0A0E9RTI6_ANGAN
MRKHINTHSKPTQFMCQTKAICLNKKKITGNPTLHRHAMALCMHRKCKTY